MKKRVHVPSETTCRWENESGVSEAHPLIHTSGLFPGVPISRLVQHDRKPGSSPRKSRLRTTIAVHWPLCRIWLASRLHNRSRRGDPVRVSNANRSVECVSMINASSINSDDVWRVAHHTRTARFEEWSEPHWDVVKSFGDSLGHPRVRLHFGRTDIMFHVGKRLWHRPNPIRALGRPTNVGAASQQQGLPLRARSLRPRERIQGPTRTCRPDQEMSHCPPVHSDQALRQGAGTSPTCAPASQELRTAANARAESGRYRASTWEGRDHALPCPKPIQHPWARWPNRWANPPRHDDS